MDLKLYIKKLELDYPKLATLTGIDQPLIKGHLSGRSVLPLRDQRKLAEVLRITQIEVDARMVYTEGKDMEVVKKYSQQLLEQARTHNKKRKKELEEARISAMCAEIPRYIELLKEGYSVNYAAHLVGWRHMDRFRVQARHPELAELVKHFYKQNGATKKTSRNH